MAIIKRRSWGYKTPPTRKVWMIMSQVMTIPKNNVLRYLMICFVFGTNLSIKIIFGNFYFLLIAITQNIQTLQIGGVLETSGPPLDDGHRERVLKLMHPRLSYSWKNKWANLNDAKCRSALQTMINCPSLNMKSRGHVKHRIHVCLSLDHAAKSLLHYRSPVLVSVSLNIRSISGKCPDFMLICSGIR